MTTYYGVHIGLRDDGDRMVVVFLGEPSTREVCFVGGKYVTFDSNLHRGQVSSVRVALNVALYSTREVYVFECSMPVFKNIVRVRDTYGLEGWAFEVQRHGEAFDKATTYSIFAEHQLSPEEREEFQRLALHDLEEIYGNQEV